jgi:hypothetical protein
MSALLLKVRGQVCLCQYEGNGCVIGDVVHINQLGLVEGGAYYRQQLRELVWIYRITMTPVLWHIPLAFK